LPISHGKWPFDLSTLIDLISDAPTLKSRDYIQSIIKEATGESFIFHDGEPSDSRMAGKKKLETSISSPTGQSKDGEGEKVGVGGENTLVRGFAAGASHW
jgi:hypothetical protein